MEQICVSYEFRSLKETLRHEKKSIPAFPGGHRDCHRHAHSTVLRTPLPKMKITRVRAYLPPHPNPLFNQSDVVVTIETDAGITGIGEGGVKEPSPSPPEG